MSRLVHERSRGDVAQGWASILVGIAVVFLVGWMTLEASSPSAARTHRHDADAGLAASASSAAARTANIADASATDLDAGFLSALSAADAAPSMPSGAPRHVKIGVVLVTFSGAEGAPPTARSKREARAIADRLVEDARVDFHHAVSGGDPGSADDIGRLPRGVLDPRTEISVFALGTGEVSDVLETPRGYWIAKRID